MPFKYDLNQYKDSLTDEYLDELLDEMVEESRIKGALRLLSEEEKAGATNEQ